MSYFTQNGDVFAPTAGKDALLNTLPVGNYIVIETMMGLMFKRVDSFKDPGRMYGNINKRAERILRTFEDRPRTTGVLLHGEKGSGKSQLARNISRFGYDRGYPTILVNAPFHGDAFNALLATIEQPAIVIFDEFEKVYNNDELQEQVLTLLDGVMTSQKLFVLTVNDSFRVNHHMKNRPGRLFYAIEFGGLEPEFIREYCEETLKDKDETENVLKIAALFKAFNFDMLKALVEEMNRYEESAFDAIELLNAQPLPDTSSTKYNVVATTPDGVTSAVAQVNELPMNVNGSRIGFYAQFPEPVRDTFKEETNRFFRDQLGMHIDDLEPEESLDIHVIVEGKELKKVDTEAGIFEFLTETGFRVKFERARQEALTLRSLYEVY
jgi:hypothetical protein